MQYQEYDLNHALGIRLADEIRLNGRTLPKGHELTAADIEDLKFIGIRRIFGARMDKNDLAFQTALGIVAAKLCGENTEYCINDDGSAKIIAAVDGIFECSDDRVAKFNRVAEYFILNTIKVYHPVRKGEVVAQLYTNYPVLGQKQVDEVVYRLSGNVDMLKVSAIRSRKVGLLYTKLYQNKTEEKHFTKVVKRLIKEFGGQGLEFVREYSARHEVEEIADALELSFRDDNEILFIVPAQKTVCAEDVIPSALRSIADEIVSHEVPNVGASDLIIAHKRGKKIISLPYNYDEADGTLIHRYILQAVISEKLLSFDFSHPQNIFIPEGQELSEPEQERLISGSAEPLKAGESRIAAVILAAGQSKRAGQNKLMAEVDGEPLFMKAVHAAVRSKASPVFVVTGYRHEELEEALEDLDVNIIYNPDFVSGIKTSIRLGVKSVPGFCSGVLLIPGDMPNITDSYLNKMIKAFGAGGKPQVLFSSLKGVKKNPVLWSKELYDKADIAPEDSDIRTVFMDVADYSKNVEVKNAQELLDVTFPNDIAELQKK